MCGIIGYVGEQEAAPILLEGLARLEYRGYDSSIGCHPRSAMNYLQDSSVSDTRVGQRTANRVTKTPIRTQIAAATWWSFIMAS